jgi:ATP-dependent exoDNAse (exonuclease V) beta subunit
MSIAPWSFSKAKAFKTCPKQFYHTRILKEFPQQETEAMRYGTEFHQAAEDYIRDGTPLPAKFDYAKKALDALNAKPGEKLCEFEMGLTENLEPCDFDAENVWWRGIADLVILDGERAWVVDYKTGANTRYADTGQLELMALALFKFYPEVQRVSAGLLFTVAGKLIKDRYTRDDEPRLWEKWMFEYNSMRIASEKNIWNPSPSGLCKRHCPVISCPHNGGH